MSAWLALGLACAPPLLVEARPVDGGLEVHANRPIEAVELVDAAGAPVNRRSPPPDTDTVLLAVPGPGGYRAVVTAGGTTAAAETVVPERGLHLGLAGTELALAGRVVLPVVGAPPAEVLVAVSSDVGGTLALESAGRPATTLELVPGVSRLVSVGPGPGVARLGAAEVAFELVFAPLSLEQARARLALTEVRFPVDALGAADPVHTADRVVLPSPGWGALLGRLGLGVRARPDQAPWAWQAIALENRGDAAVDVVIQSAVVDDRGLPAPGFRARVRDGWVDAPTALLRVPAGGAATAVMPVWVDPQQVASSRVFRRIRVLPLAGGEPVAEAVLPLDVAVGSTAATVGFLGAVSASAAGWALLFARTRRWLVALRTVDLAAIALLGALAFAVGGASQALGIGVAAVLGPFAPFVLGILDDAVRACLLGTLLARVPRPGVLALATAVGFTARGLVFGSFQPMDLLYLGASVLWLEGAAWLAGLTRATGWVDAGPNERWARLALGLGLANAGAVATSLAVSAVIYRLYFATGYVAALLALPGFLYVVAGCRVAVGFSDALRRVSP